jgi:formate dehydrogenase major subunit
LLVPGTWYANRLGLPGENLAGVITGLELLQRSALGTPPALGGRVAVIGGGNVAVDAARSARRLGAGQVTLLYRRSEAEMPALPEEVEAARKEGVRLEFLASPIRLLAADGKIGALEFIRNILRTEEEGGQPRPVPVAGSEASIPVDTVVVAVGQSVDISFVDQDPEIKGMSLSESGRPLADPQTMKTSLPYLFAGGDFYRGPQTVIQAVADGRRAALSIHQYLSGQTLHPEAPPFNVSKGPLAMVDPANFEGIPRQVRQERPRQPLPDRLLDFREIEGPLSEEEARREAERCLSCGCLDAFNCRLRSYSAFYQLDPARVPSPAQRMYPLKTGHPFIEIDPNKCIVCRQCVHGCSDYQVQYAFDLEEIPASSESGPPMYVPGINDRCIKCGLCLAYCPTGALEWKADGAPGPWKLERTKTTCTYCGVGCQLYLEKAGDRIVQVNGVERNSPNRGHLCVKGRFGFKFIQHPDRLKTPLIREGARFREASWEEALDLVARKWQDLRETYGSNALAALSSARATNEENYLLQKMVRAVWKTNNIDHCARL